MIEKPLLDLLTLATTFYDVSVLSNRFLKAQKAQIWAGGNAGAKGIACFRPFKLRLEKQWSILKVAEVSRLWPSGLRLGNGV